MTPYIVTLSMTLILPSFSQHVQVSRNVHQMVHHLSLINVYQISLMIYDGEFLTRRYIKITLKDQYSYFCILVRICVTERYHKDVIESNKIKYTFDIFRQVSTFTFIR